MMIVAMIVMLRNSNAFHFKNNLHFVMIKLVIVTISKSDCYSIIQTKIIKDAPVSSRIFKLLDTIRFSFKKTRLFVVISVNLIEFNY